MSSGRYVITDPESDVRNGRYSSPHPPEYHNRAFKADESSQHSDLHLGVILNEKTSPKCSENTNIDVDNNGCQSESHDEEFEMLPIDESSISYKIFTPLEGCGSKLCSKATCRIVKIIILLIIVLAYYTYFAYCVYLFSVDKIKGDKESYIRLMWVTSAVTLLCVFKLFRKCTDNRPWRKNLTRNLDILIQKVKKKTIKRFPWVFRIIAIILVLAFFIGVAVWIGTTSTKNLFSLLGLITLLLISFLMSTKHSQINWQPVVGGIVLQLIFAILILRTQWGYACFDFIGQRVSEFLGHVSSGAQFVFGDSYAEHFFAFSVLPTIVYFSAIISVLFHFGILQAFISVVGESMKFVMGTTAAESLVAASNIFIGQSEAPLMVRPFVARMTNSELHSIITSGFATVSGGVMAAYIDLGVDPRHLLSASIMSAPAALAISKLAYPETKVSKTDSSQIKRIELPKHGNVIEAASAGAVSSIAIVGAIAVNLIAFMSILDFVNGTLGWFGDRAGLEFKLTFEYICSYVFWPLAYLMGVHHDDCRKVAELIGVKTFINEFVAYARLKTIRSNSLDYLSHNYTEYSWSGTDVFVPSSNTTYAGGILIDDRSYVISTYALCGFSNIASMGIMIGALTIMAPNRQSDIVRCCMRALIAGNIACFVTACIAGLFYESP